ncbi:transmembrane protein 81 [Salmo trutta]|uniref:Transmembrane protein 81 n=1 Tax=Salmo trutta TaxID=8032 RepID=A0A673XKQ8_SALTR|nr:transmembrane protein 81 [Salmo trutta]
MGRSWGLCLSTSISLVSWSFLLLCCLSSPTPNSLSLADLEDLKAVPAEVIIHSSPCSTTCGLGLRTQELCPLREGQVGEEKDCHVRKVRCVDSWQCGLQTVTVQAGQRLELDCLGEVMEAMGRFSFRVSWRYARGVVTTDDSLLGRWDAPRLDRLVLDPVSEEDAGTYRCDVQDTDYRRVKRLYLGLKVLPPEALRLDFPSALARWDDGNEDSHGNIIVVKDDEDLYGSTVIKDIVLKSLWVAVVAMVVFFLGMYRKYALARVCLGRPDGSPLPAPNRTPFSINTITPPAGGTVDPVSTAADRHK